MSLREPNGTKVAGPTDRRTTESEIETEPGELMALLDANYTREILAAIREEAKSARALTEACGASRPTVYRRLNSLQAAGLVAEDMRYDADGHHRTVFEATLEGLSVAVTDDGLSVTVRTDEPDGPETRPARARP